MKYKNNESHIKLLIDQLDLSEEEAQKLVNKFKKSITKYNDESRTTKAQFDKELEARVLFYIKAHKIEPYIIIEQKEIKDKLAIKCRQYLEKVFKIRRCHDTYYYIRDNPYFEHITIQSEEPGKYGPAREIIDELNSIVYIKNIAHYPIEDGEVNFDATSFKSRFEELSGKKSIIEAKRIIKEIPYCHKVEVGKSKKKDVLIVEWKKLYGLFNYQYLFDNILTKDIKEYPKNQNILMFKNGYYLFKEQKFYQYQEDDEIFGFDYTKYDFLSEDKISKGNEKVDNALREAHLVYNQNGEINEKLTQYEIDKHLSHHAYMLTPSNPLKRFFIWTGVTNAGKSMWTNLLKRSIGLFYVSEKALSEIVEGGFQRQTLIGKILNVSSDATDDLNDFGPIKQMTGNDPLNVQVKYGEDVIIMPHEMPNLLEISNLIPYAKFDKAMLNRITLLRFEHTIPDEKIDPNLEEELSSPENLEYLISLSLHRYNQDILTEKTNVETILMSMSPIEAIMGQLFIPTDDNGDTILIKDFHKSVRCRAEELSVVEDIDFTPTGKVKKVSDYYNKVFDRFLQNDSSTFGRVYKQIKFNPEYKYLLEDEVQ